MSSIFVLPTKPMTVIDAINRMCLATGGHRNAMLGSSADYNGHNINVWYNSYRGNWTADYTWGGQVVIERSRSLTTCLESAKAVYATQGRGASVTVTVETDEDAAACVAAGYIAAADEDRTWRDWRFDEINSALMMERHGFGPYTAWLAQSATVAEYESKQAEWRTQRQLQRKAS